MIYLFGGHHIEKGVGTGAKTALYDEAVLASEMCEQVAIRLRSQAIAVWRDNPNQEQRSEIESIAELVKPEDIVVDFHFNASTNSKATGVEVFVPSNPSIANILLASELAIATSKVLGLRLRTSQTAKLPLGVKLHTETQHGEKGLFIMRRLKAVVCLVEIAFITNAVDMKTYMEKRFELADKYTSILMHYERQNQKIFKK